MVRLALAVADLGPGGRRVLARRPEAWVYVLAGAAAVSVIVGALAADGHAGAMPASQDDHHHHAADHPAGGIGGPATSGLAPALGAWGWWLLMVLSMMLPVVAPHARRVALRSLWSRRHRAIATFLAGYLAVWALIGAVLVAILAGAGWPRLPSVGVAAVLALAAGWQVARPRRRVLRRCASPRPAALRGWRADRDCASNGWRAGTRCAVTCGPVMLTMAMSHSVLLMGGITTLLLTERARGPNPTRRAGRAQEAWGLAALASVVALRSLA